MHQIVFLCSRFEPIGLKEIFTLLFLHHARNCSEIERIIDCPSPHVTIELVFLILTSLESRDVMNDPEEKLFVEIGSSNPAVELFFECIESGLVLVDITGQ